MRDLNGANSFQVKEIIQGLTIKVNPLINFLCASDRTFCMYILKIGSVHYLYGKVLSQAKPSKLRENQSCKGHWLSLLQVLLLVGYSKISCKWPSV